MNLFNFLAVWNDMLSVRCPKKMAKNGDRITLHIDRETTTKGMNPALYEELTFSWEKSNSSWTQYSWKMILLNFDQTPVVIPSSTKTTYTDKGNQFDLCQLLM